MIINNFIGKRLYYTKKDLIAKSKEKPFLYTIQILYYTKKDEFGKTYLERFNFDKIREKYLNKTNIIYKIKLFINSMFSIFITYWKTRKIRVSRKVAEQRFETCKSCESYNKTLGTCSICGCSMKLKTKLSGVSCPAQPPKWV